MKKTKSKRRINTALGAIDSAVRKSAADGGRASGKTGRVLEAVEAVDEKMFVRPNVPKPIDSLAFEYAMAEISGIPRKKESPSHNPLFIIGYRRSDTTLLSWLLDSHREIASLPENQLYRSFLHQADRGVPFGVIYSLANTINEPRERFIDRIAGLIDDVFLDYAMRQGKSRWACKELFLSGSLDKLHRLFNFEARFLYIYRHGLDVAFSASECSGMNLFLSGKLPVSRCGDTEPSGSVLGADLTAPVDIHFVVLPMPKKNSKKRDLWMP